MVGTTSNEGLGKVGESGGVKRERVGKDLKRYVRRAKR